MSEIPTRYLLAVLSASVMLSACSLSTDGNEARLKEELRQLRAENNALKAKLATPKKATDLPATNLPNIETKGKTPELSDLSEVAQKTMIEDLNKLAVFGDLQNKFRPFEKISRGEYVEWLYKAHNAIMPPDKQIVLAPQAEPFFKDLGPEHKAYKYAQALANAGYSVGYEDGTFQADKPLSREELLGMKVGVDCGKSFEPYRGQMAFVWKFSDSKDIAERFTGYIHQDFYSNGKYGTNINRAFGKLGTFRPKQAVLRCEAAGSLWQMGQFGHHNLNAEAKTANKN